MSKPEISDRNALKKFNLSLEKLNSELVNVRKITDVKICKILGIDTQLALLVARPYLERVSKQNLQLSLSV